MELPSFPSMPSLPSLPTLAEVKAKAQGVVEDAQEWYNGPPETEAAEPENDLQINPELSAETSFEPGAFQMPTARPEPSPVEIIQGVQRLGQPGAAEDMETLSHYLESRSSYDITDPKAYVLETAAGYSGYMPQIAQSALAQELGATYTQAMEHDLTYVLDQNTGGQFSALSPEQQSRALSLLTADGALEALLPEIQGAGGGNARTGTASGEKGHYVNSPLTSMSQLIREGKVDDDLLGALEKLRDVDRLEPQLQQQAEELFNSTLQNVAFPEQISQHSKGTCAATRVEAFMAMDDPSGYTDTIRRLASPTGRAREDHAYLQRVPGTESIDDSGRSVASRLLQPALMEYANGRSLDYDNVSDRHHVNDESTSLRDGADGLTTSETRYLLEGVFGEKRIEGFHSIFGDGSERREEVLAATEQMVADGKTPLMVDLAWGTNDKGEDGGHALLLSDLDADSAYFMNPWGELNTMPREEFDARLRIGIALSDPPAIPPRAQSKGNYSELVPERYFRADQLLFSKELQERSEQILDPALQAEVKAHLPKLHSKDELTALLATLNSYLMVQDDDNTEFELSELRALMP